MKLHRLLEGISVEEIIHPNPDLEIVSLAMDSRSVSKGVFFVAIRGGSVDGHHYIQEALRCGAVAVLCERIPDRLSSEVSYIRVANTPKVLSYVAAHFYGHPSRHIKVVGITGTNAKTSMATLLYGACIALGFSAGLISTIEVKVNHQTFSTDRTTPDAITTQRWLGEMHRAGCAYVFMEVSSHALDQYRVSGVCFAGAVFSNLTQDHLDYHQTMKCYRDTKKKLFDRLKSKAFALSNADDPNGRYMLQNTLASKHYYSLNRDEAFRIRVETSTLDGLCLRYDTKEFWVSWVGLFNASNMAAVFGVLRLLEVASVEEVCRVLSGIPPPRGRMERVITDRYPHIFVDYAHTPNALEKVLKTLWTCRKPAQRIVVVVGCGGHRDVSKRAQMGKIAATFGDKVIFTSDNPRFEVPEEIIDQMLQGVPSDKDHPVTVVVSRKEAIARAVYEIEPRDILIVAGKGHETYQEIKGELLHFDDREEIIKCIKRREDV